MPTAATRTQSLSLYRSLLRAARQLPTRNRRQYVLTKAKHEFTLARAETDPEKLTFLLTYGYTCLENVQSQCTSLRQGALFAPWSK